MPDFRGETLYLVVVDRFAEADPTDPTGKGAGYDPTRTRWSMRWGGDLDGLTNALPEIRALGMTTVVVTPLWEQLPPVVEPDGAVVAPYHGYSPARLDRIDPAWLSAGDDPELGMDNALARLVAKAHGLGLGLVMDIGGHDSVAVAGHAPDAEDIRWRRAVQHELRRWLDAGLDGFRVSAVKNLPAWYWQELRAELQEARPDVVLFGEWFQSGWHDPGAVQFASASGYGMIDFAWRHAIVNALGMVSDRGFAALAEVHDHDVRYRDGTNLVTFIDSLELPRFASVHADADRYRAAVLLTMLSRGVPCLFYGGESRVFSHDHRGHDPYNRPWLGSLRAGALGAEIATAASLRRANAAIQKGGTRTKWLDADRFAFTRVWHGFVVLVAVNRSNAPAGLGLTDIELPDGTYADVFGGASIEVLEGTARMVVPPKSIVCYEARGVAVTGKVLVDLQMHGYRTEFGEDVYVVGDAPELGAWDLAAGVKLEYINANTWGATVAFDASAGRDVRYKFVVRRRGDWLREPGRLHTRRAPREPGRGGSLEGRVDAIWRDDWRS